MSIAPVVTELDPRYSDRNLSAGRWPSVAFQVRPTTIYAHAKGDRPGHTTHRF
jgi:hypothetical protein